jgi:Leucine-rich repeat (LRR) protein
MIWLKANIPLVFTLSYRYASSESICEFILHSDISKHWIVPNTINSWFDWFGLAFANFNQSDTQVTLNAYKNGQSIGTETITVNPNHKKVDLSDKLWTQSHIGYTDVDLVVVDSDLPIPNPIAITGNTDQNRHVFFQGKNMSSTINIPDAGFKAFLVSNYDSNSDGEISAGEALIPMEMDTPGTINQPGTFQNLEGLQFFTNLISFEASFEQITSIPDISNLKKLTYLGLQNNPITLIPDLINVTALTSLDIIDTSIETLHRLPASLQNLYASSGKIKNVDLTDLPNLTYCTLSYNPAETVKTTNLPKLTIFKAEYCSITDLDFSTCPNLVDLYLQEGKLTSLNISNCHSLHHLDADGNTLSSITGFNHCKTTLKTLYLSRNVFTSLDVSGFSNLVGLSCNSNGLQSLNITGTTALTRILANMNELTTLNLTGFNKLEEVDTQRNQLTQLDLTNKPYLTKVAVGYNKLTSLSFSGSNALEEIYCSYNMLENIPDVTAASNMETYWCYHNNFGPDDCPVIKAIEAMNLQEFVYNPQEDGSTVSCP